MRRFRLVAPFVVTMLVLAACTGDEDGSPGAGGDGDLGGTVSILAVYADAEQDNFLAMIQPWADEHGVEIEYTSTRSLRPFSATLSTRLSAFPTWGSNAATRAPSAAASTV